MELLASGTGLSLRVLVELPLWSSHGIQAQAINVFQGPRPLSGCGLVADKYPLCLDLPGATNAYWVRRLSDSHLRCGLRPQDQSGSSFYDLVRDTRHTQLVSSLSVKHYTRRFQGFRPSPKVLADQGKLGHGLDREKERHLLEACCVAAWKSTWRRMACPRLMLLRLAVRGRPPPMWKSCL